VTLRRYLQLDVFADRPGAGNPLAVVIDAEGFEPAAMQAFAAWTNLSETIFLLPPGSAADYRIRIFTPRQELPFAGHPSVGAAWAALDAGMVQLCDGRLVQQCAAGLLPVRIVDVDGRRKIHVRAPRPRRLEATEQETALLDAAIARLPRGALTPGLWDAGPHWWVVELADEQAVRCMSPDLAAISALPGLVVFAPSRALEHQLVLRAFTPSDGVPEDPVTGSANVAIASALAADGRLPGDGRYIASQGRELGRDGRVEVQVDAADEVWIGGHVHSVIRGTVHW